MSRRRFKRVALVASALLLATAGYATAAGTLRIIRLHSGQSVRIGNVKVLAVGSTRTVTRRSVTTITGPARTVTAPGQTVPGPTTTVTRTVTGPTTTVTTPGAATTVTVPGATQTVTVTVPTTTTPPSGPKTSFSDGTYRVNVDIAAGTYKSPGGSSCYWERLKGFSGTLDDIIANGFGETSPIVTIASSDAGFSMHSCGTWTKI